MNKIKTAALLLSLLMLIPCLGSCNKKQSVKDDGNALKVAVLESAYGKEMWEEICEGFKKLYPDTNITLTAEKNLEDIIGPKMKSGDWPDYVHLATGREAALTETLIKDEALLELSDVLSMKVPGEDITVSQKLIPGFTDTRATNPYSDEKTYLAPMFYSPCGLFYNAGLFREKGWDIPETFDELWALAEEAKKDGIYLFTYATAGYLDSFIPALLTSVGGIELYNACMTYEKGAWDSEGADRVFEIMGRIAEYTAPTTVANASSDNYLKNQQLILDNKALFMPCGTWVVEEMADAPRAEGFEWGFCALPGTEATPKGCSYTFFEQGWIPKGAENTDLAKKFLAFLYSDTAAEIFASHGAVQPIKSSIDFVSEENRLFYSVYDSGAEAVMGTFAATDSVEGVSMATTLFEGYNSVVSGDKTVAVWQREVVRCADALRDHVK